MTGGAVKLVRFGTLKNGFRFYTQKDPSTHLMGVGIKGGSMYDPPGRSGMFHLKEHVLCRETRDIVSRALELKFREFGCGPREDIDIHTSRYATFYGTDNLVRRAHALELFPHFAGMMRNRIVHPHALSVELSAAFNEYLHHGEDSTEDIVDIWMHKTMYERNPARGRIDCEEEDLRVRITPQSMEESIKTWYVPNNMFALILGLSHQKAWYLAEKYFGDLKPGEIIRPTTDELRPVLTGIKTAEIVRRVERRYPGEMWKPLRLWHLGIGFPTHPFGHADDEAIEILTEILQFRAEDILREGNHKIDEGTYHPLVNISRSYLHGLFYLWFETPSADFVRIGEERFICECEKVKRGGVDETEITRAIEGVDEGERAKKANALRRKHRKELTEEFVTMRNKKRNAYRDAFESNPGRLTSLIIESAANRDEEMVRLNSYRDRLNRVTRSRIVQVANEYLTTPDRYVRVVIRPPAE